MNGLSSVGLEGIFRRTPKGQSAVTSRRRQLSACEFSLLLMVNGPSMKLSRRSLS